MEKLFSVILLSICFLNSGYSEEAAATPIDPGAEKFVKEYVAAVNSKDSAKLKALVHPKCLAAINDENKEFFTDYFERGFHSAIPADYKKKMEIIKPDDPLLFGDMLTYPIRPTHSMQISFQTEKSGSMIIRQLINENGQWFDVVPTPKPETLVKMKEAKAESQKDEARAKELFAALKDPLLAELKEFLKAGNEIEALKKYSAASGESYGMGRRVLALLKQNQAK
jgi:hypothetical protein